MKTWPLLLLTLSGCASVEVTKDGDNFSWKSSTLFKDVQEVKANGGGFDFSLGSSTSTLTPEQSAALACLFASVLCQP